MATNILKNFVNKATTFFKEKAGKAPPAQKIVDYIEQLVKKTFGDAKREIEPVSKENWYRKSAQACEAVSDALLRKDKGVSKRIVKGISGKLGFTGTGVGIFSIASLLGLASTGTAIGSLSGAAFTSAALAWVGGSVAIGSAIIGVASIAGGLGAILGAGWAYRKFGAGEKREKGELEEQEIGRAHV